MFPLVALLSLFVAINAEGHHLKGRPAGYSPVLHQAAIGDILLDQISLTDLPTGQVAYGSKSVGSHSPISQHSVADGILTQQQYHGGNPSHIYFTLGDSARSHGPGAIAHSYRVGQSQVPYGVSGLDYSSYPEQQYRSEQAAVPSPGIGGKGYGGGVKSVFLQSQKGISGIGSGSYASGKRNPSYRIGQSTIPYGPSGSDFYSYPEQRPSYEISPFSSHTKTSPSGIHPGGTKGAYPSVVESSSGIGKGGISTLGGSGKGSFPGSVGGKRGIASVVSKTSPAHPSVSGIGQGKIHFTIGDSQIPYHIGQSQIPYGATGQDFYSYPNIRATSLHDGVKGGIKGGVPDSRHPVKGGSHGSSVSQRPISVVKGIGGLTGGSQSNTQKGIKTSPGAIKGAHGNVQFTLGDAITSYQIGQSQIPYGATGHDYSSYPLHRVGQSHLSDGVKSVGRKGGISSLGTSSKGGVSGLGSSNKGGIAGIGASSKGGVAGSISSSKGGIIGLGTSSKGGSAGQGASSKGGIHGPFSQTPIRTGQIKGNSHVQFALGDSQTSYHIGQSQIPYGASGIDYYSYPSGYSQPQSKTTVTRKISGSPLGGGNVKSVGAGSFVPSVKGQTSLFDAGSAQHKLTGISGGVIVRPVTTSHKTYVVKRDTSIASKLAQQRHIDIGSGIEDIHFSIDDPRKISLYTGRGGHSTGEKYSSVAEYRDNEHSSGSSLSGGSGLSGQSRSTLSGGTYGQQGTGSLVELSGSQGQGDITFVLDDSRRTSSAGGSLSSLSEKHGSGASAFGDLTSTTADARRSQSLLEKSEFGENPAKIKFTLGDGQGFSTFGSHGSGQIAGTSTAGQGNIDFGRAGVQTHRQTSGRLDDSLRTSSRLGSLRTGAGVRSGSVGFAAGSGSALGGSDIGTRSGGAGVGVRSGGTRVGVRSGISGVRTGLGGSGIASLSGGAGDAEIETARRSGPSVVSTSGIQSYSTGSRYRQRVTSLGGGLGAGAVSTGTRSNLRQSYGTQSLRGASVPSENPAKIQFSFGDGQGFSTYGTQGSTQTLGSGIASAGLGAGSTGVRGAGIRTYGQNIAVGAGHSGVSTRSGSISSGVGTSTRSGSLLGHSGAIPGGLDYGTEGQSYKSYSTESEYSEYTSELGGGGRAGELSGSIGSFGAGIQSAGIGGGAGTGALSRNIGGSGASSRLTSIGSGAGSVGGARVQSYTIGSGYRQSSTNLGGGIGASLQSTGRTSLSQRSRAQGITRGTEGGENPAKIQFSLGGHEGFSTFGSQGTGQAISLSRTGEGSINFGGENVQKYSQGISSIGGVSRTSIQPENLRVGAGVRSSSAGVGARSGSSRAAARSGSAGISSVSSRAGESGIRTRAGETGVGFGGAGAGYRSGGTGISSSAQLHSTGNEYKRITTIGGSRDVGSQAYQSAGDYHQGTSRVGGTSGRSGGVLGSGVQSYSTGGRYSQRASSARGGANTPAHLRSVGSDIGVQSYGSVSRSSSAGSGVGVQSYSTGARSGGAGIQSYSTGSRYRQRVTSLGGGLGAGAVSTGTRSNLRQSYGTQSLTGTSIPSENPAKIQFSFGDGQGFSTYGTQGSSQISGSGIVRSGVGSGSTGVRGAGIQAGRSYGQNIAVGAGRSGVSSRSGSLRLQAGVRSGGEAVGSGTGSGSLDSGFGTGAAGLSFKEGVRTQSGFDRTSLRLQSGSSGYGEGYGARSGAVGHGVGVEAQSRGAGFDAVVGVQSGGGSLGGAGTGARAGGYRVQSSGLGAGIQSYNTQSGYTQRVSSLGGSLGGDTQSYGIGGQRSQNLRNSEAFYIDKNLNEQGVRGLSSLSLGGDELQTRNLGKEKFRASSGSLSSGRGESITHSLDNPAKITFTLGGEKIIDYSLPSSTGGSQSHSTSFRSQAQVSGSTSSNRRATGSSAGTRYSGQDISGTQDSVKPADIYFTLGEDNVIGTAPEVVTGRGQQRTASYRSQSHSGSSLSVSDGHLGLENQGTRDLAGDIRSGTLRRANQETRPRVSSALRDGTQSSGQGISTIQGSGGPAQIYFSLGDSTLIDTSSLGGSSAAGRSSSFAESHGSRTHSSGSTISGLSGKEIYLTDEDIASGKVITLGPGGLQQGGSTSGSSSGSPSRGASVARSSVSYSDRIERGSEISHGPLESKIDIDSIGIIDADTGSRSQEASQYKQTYASRSTEGASGSVGGAHLTKQLHDIGSLAEGSAQAVQKKLEQILV